MRETRTSGSVGAPGGRPPGATRRSGRDGRDRRKHFRYAHGSLLEARTALRLAALWGYLDDARYADAERLADRLAGMLWRLTR